MAERTNNWMLDRMAWTRFRSPGVTIFRPCLKSMLQDSSTETVEALLRSLCNTVEAGVSWHESGCR